MNSVVVGWTVFFVVAANLARIPMPLLNQFRAAKGVLEKVEIISTVPSESTTTHDFRLINDKNDSVVGRIRVPNTQQGRFPVAFLVAGVETGKDVVSMVEGYHNVVVVSIDYPLSGSFDVGGWKALGGAFALRETAFKTVPRILLCLDWLSTSSTVDTSSITMIAVSFGVLTAVPAAVADTRVRRLVVVQGGGDLPTIIAANSARLNLPVPAWLAGLTGSWILAPFEPNRYVGSFAPRPLLMVSGDSDAFFPTASAQSLYNHANKPKEWIQYRSGHVMPGEQEAILELTQLVAQHLYGIP